MPRFRYQALDDAGKTENGFVDASDDSEAYALLRSRGLSVFDLDRGSASAAREPWYARQISFGDSQHSLNDQAAVADLIGMLADLRLPVTQMIEIVADRAATPSMQRHLRRMNAAVADGASLGDAFAEAGPGFSPVFAQLLSVAEAGNTLSTAMRDLAKMLRRSDRVRGKVSAALVYPAILLLASVLLVAMIGLYLAPALEPMFSALDRPMPAMLAGLMWIGETVQAQSVATGIAGLAVVGTFLLGFVAPQFAGLRSRLVQALPLIGSIVREGQLLRHVAALGMLLRGGLALPEALETAGGVDHDSRYCASFVAGANSLRQGTSAVDGMRGDGRLPELALGLFAVGEEANRLSETSDTLAEILEQSVERRIERAMQLLTPVLTLLIGGVIGGLVFSVMSAILDVNTLAF